MSTFGEVRMQVVLCNRGAQTEAQDVDPTVITAQHALRVQCMMAAWAEDDYTPSECHCPLAQPTYVLFFL